MEQKACKNETTSAKCVKCNRNVISRGVYCSRRLHWVHYICHKLTMCEIQDLEATNSNENYVCKMCNMKNQINQSACQAIMDVNNTTKKCQTRLLDLLDEKLTMTCSICSVVIDDQVYRCSQCSQPCHSHCSTSDEYDTM